MRPGEPVDPAVVTQALESIREWRSRGLRVLVHSGEGVRRGALIVCLALMDGRGWDYATALWMLRSRRSAAFPSDSLWGGRAPEELVPVP